jgi:hypothetical protein
MIFFLKKEHNLPSTLEIKVSVKTTGWRWWLYVLFMALAKISVHVGPFKLGPFPKCQPIADRFLKSNIKIT